MLPNIKILIKFAPSLRAWMRVVSGSQAFRLRNALRHQVMGRTIWELARKSGHGRPEPTSVTRLGKGKMGMDAHFTTLCPVSLLQNDRKSQFMARLSIVFFNKSRLLSGFEEVT
ncbi:MAG: hypothetical protein DRR19_26690 [Candidatus Parabeggiatoa sp. nov. 1]|nr:MAG: hypothetical protein DRR19_26690 [Gammaproteobacteria bacterium]